MSLSKNSRFLHISHRVTNKTVTGKFVQIDSKQMPGGHDTAIEVSTMMSFVLYTQILKQSVLKPASPGITLIWQLAFWQLIIKMLEFLVDNIFVVFAGKVFQQTVGISMGTNYAPLLADIFLYSYEADFIQSLLSTGKKHLASRFNLTYRKFYGRYGNLIQPYEVSPLTNVK